MLFSQKKGARRVAKFDYADINRLIDEFSKGNYDAYVALCNDYYEYFYNYILKLTKHEFNAKDLTQKFFIKIRRINFTEVKKPVEFLKTTAKNLTINFLVSPKLNREVALEIAYTKDHGYDDIYKNIALNDLMAGLTKQECAILELRYIYDFDVKEVAKMLDISVPTLCRRIKCIKQKVKENATPRNLLVLLLLFFPLWL